MNVLYEAFGKQVTASAEGQPRQDFAQACDTYAAIAIANAMNNFVGAVEVPCDICEQVGGHVSTCENGRAAKCEPTSDAMEKPDT